MLKSIRRIRKMTYVLWAWCLMIIVWAVAGAASTPAQHCGAYQKACVEGAQAGTGIGVAIILFVGFIGFVFFSLIWFMTRPKERVATS